MGGLGSGLTYQYWRPPRKTTVEECKVLTVKGLRKLDLLKPDTRISRTLSWGGDNPGAKSIFGITVDTANECPHIVLSYRSREREESFEYLVRLSTTEPPFGGVRWWLHCPLVFKAGLCDSRVTKLFLPMGRKYVGCRKCLNLGYRSSQESHKYDRLYVTWAKDLE
ncbi:MAG: hypothetical protein ACFCD0_13560 [Gemmataceae bacterium]